MPSSLAAYCDESGERDYGTGTADYFVVTGVVVDATEAPHLEDEIRGLKRTYWGSPDIEIKSNWIRRPEQRQKRYTDPHGLSLKEIDELVSGLYRWMRKAPISLLAGVVDKPMMVKQYTAPHYAGAVAYTMLLQRLQKYASKRSSTASVIFDDPAGKSPGGHDWRDLLQRQHSRLKRAGCPYTKTTFTDIGPLTFTDSATSPFVQVADIVAYNTFRQFRQHGKAWEDNSIRTLPLYDHFKKIVRLFDTGEGGVFAGYGVAKWPLETRIKWYMT
jgi:Protein of unknown function (DUF3800)